MLILIAMETMTQCRVSTMRGVRLISSDCRRLTHYYFSNLDKNLFFLLYSWWFSYFFFGITFSSTFFPSIWMSIQFFCINNMPTCCTSILFTQNLLLIQISHTHTLHQTKCWNRKILVWLRGSMTSSDKCWSSKRKFCHLNQHSRKCWGASTFSTAIHHAYQRQHPRRALTRQQSKIIEVSS